MGKYKKHFIEYKFGLPAVREYPIGMDSQGDVDSGPVILGIGTSAIAIIMYNFLKN